MSVDEEQVLAYSNYWDSGYSKSNGEAPTHEWYRSFSELETFFQDNMFGLPRYKAETNPKILHLGSGDSVCHYQSQIDYHSAINCNFLQVIPVELAVRGYNHQICIDFSQVVVKLMSERHSKIEGIEWKYMDVRNMADIPDKSIDIAFDKGTLDVMIYGSPWSPPGQVKEDTSKYIHEVHRVLKDDGVFFYVTFRQPHFQIPLLNLDNLWHIEAKVLRNDDSFDYYGYIMKKVW
ncbi:hypothetical protein GGI35DRAFT_453654 [Trichoderma velutinum]